MKAYLRTLALVIGFIATANPSGAQTTSPRPSAASAVPPVVVSLPRNVAYRLAVNTLRQLGYGVTNPWVPHDRIEAWAQDFSTGTPHRLRARISLQRAGSGSTVIRVAVFDAPRGTLDAQATANLFDALEGGLANAPWPSANPSLPSQQFSAN
jgi:hypothetical protein